MIQQSIPQGPGHEFGDRMHFKLPHQACTMVVDRLWADTKPVRDLVVGKPGGDQRKDFALPWREVALGFKALQNLPHFPGNVGSALKQQIETAFHFLRRCGLEKKAVDAGRHPIGQHAGRPETGQDRDTGLGRPAPGFGIDLHALSVRHGDVEHEQCGFVPFRKRDRLNAVLGFGDNFSGRHVPEHGLQSRAHKGMIIGNDNGPHRIPPLKPVDRQVTDSDQQSAPCGGTARGPGRFGHVGGQPKQIRIGAAGLLLTALIGAMFTASLPASADENPPILNVQSGSVEGNLLSRLWVLDDPDLTLTLKDARKVMIAGAGMRPLAKKALHGPGWGVLKIRNTGRQSATFVLDMRQAFWWNATLYVINEQGKRKLLDHDPERQAYSNRDPSERLVRSLPFTLAAESDGELWVRFFQPATTQFDLWISPLEITNGYRVRNAAIEGLYYGLTLTLIAFVLAFAAILRSQVALYYAGFYAFFVLQSAQTSGLLFQYVWPDWPALNGAFSIVIRAPIIVFYVLMLKSFLGAAEHYPRFNKALNILLVCGITLAPLYLYQPIYFILPVLGTVLAFAILVLWGAILGVRDRISGSVLFLGGTIILFANSALGSLAWIIDDSLSISQTNEIIRVGQIVDGLLFASAVVAQAIGLRRGRDLAVENEFKAVQDKLALTERLRHEETEHGRAREMAETRRAQLAAASHDMRQPLLSLRLAVQRAAEQDPEARETANRGIDFLQTLLRRQLDETRPGSEPETGAITDDVDSTERETFPLSTILENVAFMFADEAAQKELDLRTVISRVEVLGDPVALIRVMTNLVANAVRHTDTGKILIGARREGKTMRLEVWDTGPGLQPQDRERLQQPYERGSHSTGHGLGLALVRDLADAHGYRFQIRSEPGAGSVFSLGNIERKKPVSDDLCVNADQRATSLADPS